MRKIKFISIPCRDQDKALAFWTEKMGLQVTTDQPMGPGQRWIELKVPGKSNRRRTLHAGGPRSSHRDFFWHLVRERRR